MQIFSKTSRRGTNRVVDENNLLLQDNNKEPQKSCFTNFCYYLAQSVIIGYSFNSYSHTPMKVLRRIVQGAIRTLLNGVRATDWKIQTKRCKFHAKILCFSH